MVSAVVMGQSDNCPGCVLFGELTVAPVQTGTFLLTESELQFGCLTGCDKKHMSDIINCNLLLDF